MNFRQYPVEACTDCVYAAANGGLDDMAEPVSPEPLALLGAGEVIVPDDAHVCEGHFSSYACETCGQRLAGTRFCYVLLVPVEVTA